MNIHNVLDILIEKKGSDIHIIVGSKITLRIDGSLFPVDGSPVIGQESSEALILPLMTREQKELIKEKKELDFGYQYKDKGRFRVNVYHHRGNLSACLRLVPDKIKTIEELNLPPIMHELAKLKQGLVLLTGPTGEGKSTSLAAIIDEINSKRSEHIVTIEDPIEFVYQPKRSLISQRELNQDTLDWSVALRSVLREDPNVVLVGEMRDYETVSAAMTVAETGHLVFATLHTNTASQTMDRIIDVFPPMQQGQIRQQLASVIKAVVSQRLVPMSSGGRVPASEVMIANAAVRNLIREGKTYQIDNVMQTSADAGMVLIETNLYSLVQRGAISAEKAKEYAFRPKELERLMGV
ncbi:MAG: type IV pilus twitching motility protein PilT [Patescibacteria group bacterium]